MSPLGLTDMSSCSNDDHWKESQMRADDIRARLKKSPFAPADGIDRLVSEHFDLNPYQEERRSAQFRFQQESNQMSR